MLTIVIDTNIIVSSLISSGFPSRIVNDYVVEEKVTLLLSQSVLDEYVEVLNREKFKKYPIFKRNADLILTKLPEISIFYEPDIELNVISDKTDNKFLELAVYGQAEYLITGNTNDFTIEEYENVKILSPRKFLEIIEKQILT